MKNVGEGHLPAARVLHESLVNHYNFSKQQGSSGTHSFDGSIEFHLSSKLRIRGIIILYRTRERRQRKDVLQ